MRTSLNELRLAEAYLLQKASGEDLTLFKTRLILEPGLEVEVKWQQTAVDLIREYGRKQLKKDIKKVHRHLFTAPQHRSFRLKICSFFRRP